MRADSPSAAAVPGRVRASGELRCRPDGAAAATTADPSSRPTALRGAADRARYVSVVPNREAAGQTRRRVRQSTTTACRTRQGMSLSARLRAPIPTTATSRPARTPVPALVLRARRSSRRKRCRTGPGRGRAPKRRAPGAPSRDPTATRHPTCSRLLKKCRIRDIANAKPQVRELGGWRKPTFSAAW